MKNIFILVGYPCSGKSTFARELQNQFGYANTRTISYDGIIKDYMNANKNISYNEFFTDDLYSNDIIQKFITRMLICNSDDNIKNVIIDTTNLTFQKRQVVYDIFKKHKKFLVLFNPDKVITETRRKNRNAISDVEIPLSFMNFLNRYFKFNVIKKDKDFSWLYKKLNNIHVLDTEYYFKNMIIKLDDNVLID